MWIYVYHLNVCFLYEIATISNIFNMNSIEREKTGEGSFSLLCH